MNRWVAVAVAVAGAVAGAAVLLWSHSRDPEFGFRPELAACVLREAGLRDVSRLEGDALVVVGTSSDGVRAGLVLRGGAVHASLAGSFVQANSRADAPEWFVNGPAERPVYKTYSRLSNEVEGVFAPLDRGRLVEGDPLPPESTCLTEGGEDIDELPTSSDADLNVTALPALGPFDLGDGRWAAESPKAGALVVAVPKAAEPLAAPAAAQAAALALRKPPTDAVQRQLVQLLQQRPEEWEANQNKFATVLGQRADHFYFLIAASQADEDAARPAHTEAGGWDVGDWYQNRPRVAAPLGALLTQLDAEG